MKMEREVYLVRHGQVENPRGVLYGRLDGFGLSSNGRHQVKKLAEKFREKSVDVSKIYSSPLERTFQTAQIIGEIMDVPVELSGSLTEVECKFLEGKTKRERLAIYVLHGFDLYSPYYIKKGIETQGQIALRMRGIVDNCSETQHGNFMIVSHGDPLIFLLWSYLYEGETNRKRLNIYKDPNYLKKGEAMVLNFDSDGNFLGFKRF